MTIDTTPTTVTTVTDQSRNWAVGSHLSAFVTFLGIPGLLGPLAIWLLKQDDPYVADQAKEALNFNISFLIYGLVSALAVIVLVGIIALPVVAVTWFVLVIAASIAASRGETYRYPLTIRFIS